MIFLITFLPAVMNLLLFTLYLLTFRSVAKSPDDGQLAQLVVVATHLGSVYLWPPFKRPTIVPCSLMFCY